MQRPFDLSAVQALLQRGITAGHWTLEQIDYPSPNYEQQLIDARRSPYFTPNYEPPIPYANPLRKPNTGQVVQPIDPRDFDLAAATRPHEGQRDVDVPPLQWPPVPGQHHRPDLSRDQDPAADGGDHGDQTHLAATGRLGAPGPGGDGPPAVEPQSTRWPAGAAPF